jgi:hypothetical protein
MSPVICRIGGKGLLVYLQVVRRCTGSGVGVIGLLLVVGRFTTAAAVVVGGSRVDRKAQERWLSI